MEAQFLRHVLLGESIAPFRLLNAPLAVIPVTPTAVMDSVAASAAGYIFLARWLRQIEALWEANANKDEAGASKMTLTQRLDHMRGLTLQRAPAPLRVVYAASGTLPAAAIVDDERHIVEHKAYWTNVRSIEEGQYLCAIINSEAARLRVTDMQSKGQGGARDFDNLMWELGIPGYDERDKRHRRLAEAGARAEAVAGAVELEPKAHFTTKRRAIRAALRDVGISKAIDVLVNELLGKPAVV